jgi:hypothetical protein
MAETVLMVIVSVHQDTMARIAKVKVPPEGLPAAVLQVAAPLQVVHLHQEVQMRALPIFQVAVQTNTHAMQVLIATTAMQIVLIQEPVLHQAVHHLVAQHLEGALHRAVPVHLQVVVPDR